MSDDPSASAAANPPRREELVALLQTRARLLQPDPDLIARALRRCARYDLRAGRERFSHVSVGGGHDASHEPTQTTASVSGLDSDDHRVAVEDASRPGAGSAEGEAALPFSIGVPSAVAKAATVPEEDGSAVEAAARAPAAAAVKPVSAPLPVASGKPISGGLFQVGSEIAGYRIEGRLGRGGMGDVYRATQLSMGREVAFKVLSKKLAGDSVFRARFLREARAAGRLQHPNLIAVHDVGEQDGLLFFSMELVKGQSVGDVLKARGSYDETEALEIIKQVLEALKYAHAHGLVHRDIKPDNIMVTDRGMVKVADLGLARQVEDEEGSRAGNDQTKSGTMMGTPYYMPPEQGQDARNADARSDIYAVGATLYHMVVGQVPFKGRTPVEVVVNATTKPLRFPEETPSPKLRRLIARFMAKEAADRPHDADEAMIMLQRMMGGGSAPVTTGTSGRFGERSTYLRARYADGRQGLTVWLIIGAVVLVLLIGTLVLLDQLGRASTWDNFEEFLHKEVAAHHYARALDRIGTFQAAHPQLAERAELEREGVLAAWNRYSLDALDAQLAEFDAYLRQGDYKEATRLLQALDRRRRQDRGVAAAVERLEQARQRLVEQQDLAIDALRQDVRQGLDGGKHAQAFRQADAFGPPTVDRQEEVELILRHAGETWDAAVAARAERELEAVRRLLRQGQTAQAQQALQGLRGQEHLVSPAVKIQIQQLQVQLDRADETGYRFEPAQWLAKAQTWNRGSKVEPLDEGRFRFMGSGRVSLPEDPEMPVGMHLDLDLQVTGDVDWTISFGRLGRGCLIRVTTDRVVMTEMSDFSERPGARLDLRGAVIAEAGHRGSLRIQAVWLKDEIEISVAGLDAKPQRVPRSPGQAAFHIRWNNHGAVLLKPRLGR